MPIDSDYSILHLKTQFCINFKVFRDQVEYSQSNQIDGIE
jgi:hypothetical protein